MAEDPEVDLALAGRTAESGPTQHGSAREDNRAAAFRPNARLARRAALAWLALLLGASAVLWMVRWTIGPVRVSGDTFWYSRAAFQMAGSSPDEATRAAANIMISWGAGGTVASWTQAVHTVSPRYQAIFAERPLFPASAALLIPIFGEGALIVSAFVGGILVGPILGWFVLTMTRSRWASLVAVVLVYVLPSGRYLALAYADGWALSLWVGCLAAASLYLLEGQRRHLLGLVVLAGLLALTKSANEDILAFALVSAALVGLLLQDGSWRRVAILAGAASGVAGVILAGFAALGLPGMVESLQDYFTAHFTLSDVTSPVARLITQDVRGIPTWLQRLAAEPPTFVTVAIGAGPLAAERTSWARLWLIGGASTVLLVLLHPVRSEVARLMIPVWPTVAIGLVLWLPSLARAWRSALGHGRRGDRTRFRIRLRPIRGR